jgi:hypothetical protein
MYGVAKRATDFRWIERLVHDLSDGLGATTALYPAAETAIHMAWRAVCCRADDSSHLVVTQHVAGANNHWKPSNVVSRHVEPLSKSCANCTRLLPRGLLDKGALYCGVGMLALRRLRCNADANRCELQLALVERRSCRPRSQSTSDRGRRHQTESFGRFDKALNLAKATRFGANGERRATSRNGRSKKVIQRR